MAAAKTGCAKRGWLRSVGFYLTMSCLCVVAYFLGKDIPRGQPLQTTVTPTISIAPRSNQGFDPNRILEDSDIYNVNGMEYGQMVAFLRSKGALADARQVDIDGVEKPVPVIIWRVATTHRINPKYLLALLEKEQSLVENKAPTQKQFDWATGYGVCDSCSMSSPAVLKYRGFANQLEWAARQHRRPVVGNTRVIDGVNVTPENTATAALYSYTPHFAGNQHLVTILRRWNI